MPEHRQLRWTVPLQLATGLLLAFAGGAQSGAASLPVATVIHLPAVNQPPTLGLRAAAFLPDGSGALSVAICDGSAADGCQTGRVYLTHDFGSTWTRVPTKVAPFEDIQVVDGKHAFASNGSLYASSDGGRSWRRLSNAPPGQFWFVTPEDGYVLEQGGRCLAQDCGVALWRTSDGGAMWAEVAHSTAWAADPSRANIDVPLENFPRIVAATGPRILLWSPVQVNQLGGTLVLSPDGGRTWRLVLSGGDRTRLFASLNAQGWALESPCLGGCPVQLLHASRTGARWSVVGTVPLMSMPQLAMAPDGALWVVGQTCVTCGFGVGVVRKDVARLKVEPLPNDEAGLLPLSSHTAIAVVGGAIGPGGEVYRTTDGGRIWRTIAEFDSPVFPGSIVGFFHHNVGLSIAVVGRGTYLLKSADGGRSWTKGPAVPAENVSAAGFSDPSHGWALTSTGAEVTSDGGGHWRVLRLPQGVPRLVSFRDRTSGIALVAPAPDALARLYVTTDGGKVWREVRADVPIAAIGPGNILYALDARSTALWVSRDEGRTWIAGGALPRVGTWEMGCAQDGTLWLGNWRSFALSEDQGRSWSRIVALPPGEYFNSFDIESRSDYVIVTYAGLFRTKDAGRTWFTVAPAPATGGAQYGRADANVFAETPRSVGLFGRALHAAP